MTVKKTKAKTKKQDIRTLLASEESRERIDEGTKRMAELVCQINGKKEQLKEVKNSMCEQCGIPKKDVSFLVSAFIKGFNLVEDDLNRKLHIRYEISGVDPAVVEGYASSDTPTLLKDEAVRKLVDDHLDEIALLDTQIQVLDEELAELRTAMREDIGIDSKCLKIICDTLVKDDSVDSIAKEENQLSIIMAMRNTAQP
jgi:hypothetical protein